jgi:hypothetical protein
LVVRVRVEVRVGVIFPAVSEPFSVFIAAIKTVPPTILRTVSARRSLICRNHETRCLTYGLVNAVAMRA